VALTDSSMRIRQKDRTLSDSEGMRPLNRFGVRRQSEPPTALLDEYECKQGVDLNGDGVIQGRGADKKATIIRQSSGTGLFSAFKIPRR